MSMAAGGSSTTRDGRSGAPQSVQFPPPRKWLFSNEEMQKCASIAGGMPPEKELRYRQQATRFIQSIGDRLNHNVRDQRAKISQLCMCAAMMHMHRFFYFHSFKSFDYRDIAAASLFLSGKSEECPRKLEHIVRVWWAMKFPNHPNISQEHYVNAAQLIVTLENIILQTIAFDLSIELPHQHVLKAMHDIARANKKITEVTYFFSTDVLCVTNWGIRFSASAIAAVCIHIVCIWAEVEIPKPEDGRQWYKRIDPTMTDARLEEMTNEFTSIYMLVKDHLALTRLASKGVVSLSSAPKTGLTPRSDSPVRLPAPPVQPVIHRKVDLNEYKERKSTPTYGGSNQHMSDTRKSDSEKPAQRRSFMPDTSNVSYANVPPPDNNQWNGSQKPRNDQRNDRDKDRRDGRRDDDRRRDEYRKREHDRVSGGASHHHSEKKPRPAPEQWNPSVPPPGHPHSRPPPPLGTPLNMSKPPPLMSQHVKAMVPPPMMNRPPPPISGMPTRALSPPPQPASRHNPAKALSPPPPPSLLCPPPPPPPELEDGEVE